MSHCSRAAGALALALAVLLAPLAAGAAPEQAEIAERIRARFESELFTLPPEIQAHWALRLYRATGEERYRYSVLSHAVLLERNLAKDLAGLDDADYRRERIDQHMLAFASNSRKSRSRRALFEQHPEALYQLRMLSAWHRLGQLGFPGSAFAGLPGLFARGGLQRFLLAPEVLDIYAAQAVNYVYYLNELGVADLREEFAAAFRACFPDAADAGLSKLRFKDKIYGLTHFILADSGYFIREVDASAHGWILAYFEANADRILEETKADIIAEVGLCFLLAGQGDHPLLQRARAAVAAEFDARADMIPSVSGSTELRSGEHRNVLAVLLLDWPGRLHPGPDLSAWEESRRRLAP